MTGSAWSRHSRAAGAESRRSERMIERILTVGGWTLVSRLTGFLRDILMAAILGGGPVTDAFLVAFRLPNHFRSIFAEGPFNAAFVPAYTRVREQEGAAAAGGLAPPDFPFVVATQLVVRGA